LTGARIVRRDVSPNPLFSVETEQLENTSNIGVEATLNNMPQFVAADTAFDTNNTEPSAFVTPGIASLNLRGLGTNRNLVLVTAAAQSANALLIRWVARSDARSSRGHSVPARNRELRSAHARQLRLIRGRHAAPH
jgi:hypothetical protein